MSLPDAAAGGSVLMVCSSSGVCPWAWSLLLSPLAVTLGNSRSLSCCNRSISFCRSSKVYNHTPGSVGDARGSLVVAGSEEAGLELVELLPMTHGSPVGSHGSLMVAETPLRLGVAV